MRDQKKEPKEKTSPCPLIPCCDFIWARQKNSQRYALLKQLLLAMQRFALLPKFSIATTDGQRAAVLHHQLNSFSVAMVAVSIKPSAGPPLVLKIGKPNKVWRSGTKLFERLVFRARVFRPTPNLRQQQGITLQWDCLSLVTFFDNAKKVTCCRATPDGFLSTFAPSETQGQTQISCSAMPHEK